jgi:hypothetical protein
MERRTDFDPSITLTVDQIRTLAQEGRSVVIYSRLITDDSVDEGILAGDYEAVDEDGNGAWLEHNGSYAHGKAGRSRRRPAGRALRSGAGRGHGGVGGWPAVGGGPGCAQVLGATGPSGSDPSDPSRDVHPRLQSHAAGLRPSDDGEAAGWAIEGSCAMQLAPVFATRSRAWPREYCRRTPTAMCRCARSARS